MPQSIPAGLTRTHVLQALTDLDGGLDHPFGQPTGYELVHDMKRYPPKAVIGLACRYSLGRMLLPEEFSGGEAPGQANFVLRKLGFTVVRKGEGKSAQDTDAARDWTEQEVRLIVAAYLAMLEADLQGDLLTIVGSRGAISSVGDRCHSISQERAQWVGIHQLLYGCG